MDPTLSVALTGAVASILVAVIANRFTSRSAQAAQRRAAEIEKTKVDAEAYERARDSYDAALAAQERRIAQLTNDMEQDRIEYRAEIADCKTRIHELEAARRGDQLRMRNLITYMRQLINILRQHQIDYPPEPPEMGM